MSRYYGVCKRSIGRPVRIVTKDGREHRGIIRRVTNTHVMLEPLPNRNLGGYGYGYWGWGLGWGIALGAIATLAFLPWFVW